MLRYVASLAGRPLALASALAALWLLLSGYWTNPTLLGFGIASVIITTILSQRAGVLDGEGVPTRLFPGVIRYMLWLTLEIGKANVAVAREILRPTLRLSPRMIRVPAYQASDLGKTVFGNSVTLTPGTVTVDVAKGDLVIHALSDDFADLAGMAAMGEKVCAFDGREGREWARKNTSGQA